MRTFSPNKRLALVLLGTGAALVAWRLARHLRIPMSATEIDVPFTTASPHKLDACSQATHHHSSSATA
jgi:hypothetical protein